MRRAVGAYKKYGADGAMVPIDSEELGHYTIAAADPQDVKAQFYPKNDKLTKEGATIILENYNANSLELLMWEPMDGKRESEALRGNPLTKGCDVKKLASNTWQISLPDNHVAMFNKGNGILHIRLQLLHVHVETVQKEN